MLLTGRKVFSENSWQMQLLLNTKLECGPIPNAMATLPNIGGALCSTPQSLTSPLKFAGVPQTPEPISAVSGPKFTILWGHVEELLLFNKFFPIVDTCLNCEDTTDKVVRWCWDGDFLCPVFPASRVQHISDLHSKFTLRPHHVFKYGRHPICGRWD